MFLPGGCCDAVSTTRFLRRGFFVFDFPGWRDYALTLASKIFFNSSNSCESRRRKGLSGLRPSSKVSALSKVCSERSPLVNSRFQLRETSLSVSKAPLLLM